MAHKTQTLNLPPEQPDPWHLHTPDEGPPQEEHGKINAALLSVAFLASVLFVGVVVLVTYLYFNVQTTRLREERIETTVLSAEYVAYREKALKSLNDYSFANEQAARAGVVSLPFDQAAQRVIAKYAGGGGRP